MGKEISLDKLPVKKQGRPPLLGEKIDVMVQSYIRKVCEVGGAMTSHIVCATAHGIVLSTDRTGLIEFGGHINLNRHWAY